MIYIVITSYNEPLATIKAIESVLKQEFSKEFKLIIADPFEDVLWDLEEKFGNKIEYYQDEGKGKSVTLNQIIKQYYSKNKDEIFIFTDGDVCLTEGSIQKIIDSFEDKTIGVVCGQPISMNSKDNMLGYWSHLLLSEMNKTRKKANQKKEFFEVSGYLFAMRNGVINSFPVNASEDNVIPALFWSRRYKIGYAEEAKVMVLNPQNFKDWVIQKKRNVKGHMSLKHVNTKNIPRKNTFFGEAIRGLRFVFIYPSNVKEFFWTIGVLYGRLHVWALACYESMFKEGYKDGWREETTDSTKPLD